MKASSANVPQVVANEAAFAALAERYQEGVDAAWRESADRVGLE